MCFRPVVNGAFAEGPGAKVVVVIGENGQIFALYNLVQHWVEVQRTSLRSVGEAVADISAGKGIAPAQDWSSILVKDVHVAAYAEAVTARETQLKPVYVFTVANQDNPDQPTQVYNDAALKIETALPSQ